VARSDFWTYDSPRATVGGTDSHTYTVAVGSVVSDLKVSLSHPSLAAVGINGTSYTLTVKDPSGAVVGTSTESMTEGAGTATVQVPVTAAGTYTLDVVGNYAVSDPDTLDSDSIGGRMVTLHAAQLLKG
jgi:serine protease AprX